MGRNVDLTRAVDTSSSLNLPLKPAQLHLTERMPARGVSPSPPCYQKEEQLKPFLRNPLTCQQVKRKVLQKGIISVML